MTGEKVFALYVRKFDSVVGYVRNRICEASFGCGILTRQEAIAWMAF